MPFAHSHPQHFRSFDETTPPNLSLNLTPPVSPFPPSLKSMATLASQPPPSIEVRCAGCDETLEVEQGLTEFICPDCETPQALPPELLPRKRKALPLPRAADSGKTQLPCACCNALLNVPHGLSRFSCPKCGTELAVDNERLKGYLSRSSAASAASDVTAVAPAAVRLSRPLEIEPHTPYDAITRSTTPLATSSAFVEKVRICELNERTSLSREPVSSIINNNNINARPPSRTPAFTCVNPEQNDSPTPIKEPGTTSVSLVQVEAEAAHIPTTASILSRSNKSRKHAGNAAATESHSLDEAEPSLRRSKRLTKSPVLPKTSKQNPNKKQKKPKKVLVSPGQSQPSQNQLAQIEHAENQLDPQDIARHYNELFPMDTRRLFADSPGPHIEHHSNLSADMQLDPDSDPSPAADIVPAEIISDDEGDETYMAEPDCSGNSSNNELDENEHNQALSNALLRAKETIGSYRKVRESKHHRGPTRCLEIWNRPDNDPIEVEFNHLGQPIGNESSTLKNFLGTIARDGKLTPLNYLDWKAMPAEYKDTIWFIVKSKFKLEQIRKKYIVKATGRIWSNWKSVIKRHHYDIHDNDEDRLADINKRIVPEQWPFLVRFWSSEEGQKRSANGRESRKKVKAMHTLGTKSYARLREEERLRKPDKQEPSRAEMFILTRTRKDGTPVNEESAEIIARLREELKEEEPSKNKNPHNDILAKVLGGNKGAYKLTYGLLPNKPDLWSLGGPSNEEKERIVVEARRLADEESKPLREKIDTMEKRHKEMEEEMQKMRNTVAHMQNMFSAQQQLPNQPGPTLSFWGDR